MSRYSRDPYQIKAKYPGNCYNDNGLRYEADFIRARRATRNGRQ